MSQEETRYYLNGVYLHVYSEGGRKALRAAATDGHRLARLDAALSAGAEDMPGVIVPEKPSPNLAVSSPTPTRWLKSPSPPPRSASASGRAGLRQS